MAEPTETITATTAAAPPLEPVVIGQCADCDQDIHSGEGVVVTAAGERWHPECRATFLRKSSKAKSGAAG